MSDQHESKNGPEGGRFCNTKQVNWGARSYENYTPTLAHSQAEPLTAKQEKTLIAMVRAIGLATYREHKDRLGIERSKPIPALSKNQARELIAAIIAERGGRR